MNLLPVQVKDAVGLEGQAALGTRLRAALRRAVVEEVGKAQGQVLRRRHDGRTLLFDNVIHNCVDF